MGRIGSVLSQLPQMKEYDGELELALMASLLFCRPMVATRGVEDALIQEDRPSTDPRRIHAKEISGKLPPRITYLRAGSLCHRATD